MNWHNVHTFFPCRVNSKAENVVKAYRKAQLDHNAYIQSVDLENGTVGSSDMTPDEFGYVSFCYYDGKKAQYVFVNSDETDMSME